VPLGQQLLHLRAGRHGQDVPRDGARKRVAVDESATRGEPSRDRAPPPAPPAPGHAIAGPIPGEAVWKTALVW
jgi:hypothetical protein